MPQMSRGELRQHVRDLLGDPGPRGFWDDDELDRYITLESDRHAQEALSVETQVATSSVPGVIDYQLPDDFGEIKDVRFIENVTEGPEPLDYVMRQEILSVLGDIETVGDPWVFYRWEDAIGLYPVPNKPAILTRGFSSQRPQLYTPIVTVSGGITQSFEDTLTLTVRDDPDNRFYRVLLSHISLYLRRDAREVPGSITLRAMEGTTGYLLSSQPVPCHFIQPLGDWVHFDFSENPLEVLADTPQSYVINFDASSDFLRATDATFGNRIELAHNVVSNAKIAYFQLHQVKNDVEIDYYRNITDELTNDDELIQIPARYNRTLIKMVCGRALKKNRRSLQAALVYDREAKEEIAYARSQAAVKTLGSILRVEKYRRRHRNPYMTYIGNGKFQGRIW